MLGVYQLLLISAIFFLGQVSLRAYEEPLKAPPGCYPIDQQAQCDQKCPSHHCFKENKAGVYWWCCEDASDDLIRSEVSDKVNVSDGTCSCTQYGGGYCSGFCDGNTCPCMNCQYVNQTC